MSVLMGMSRHIILIEFNSHLTLLESRLFSRRDEINTCRPTDGRRHNRQLLIDAEVHTHLDSLFAENEMCYSFPKIPFSIQRSLK